MSKPGTYLCTNAEDNCPYYRDSTVITIGGVEKFVCPKGHTNCERDHLEPVAPPDGPLAKFLKRAAIVVVPVIIAGLVWLYFITRPAPPYKINVTYTIPPGAKVHPGDSVSWQFSIEGGRPTDKPIISAESLSPLLLSKSDLRVETVDSISRKYKLTARPVAGQTGRAEIKVSARIVDVVKAATNLAFQVVALGPPILTLQSAPPLVLESGRESLVLPFTLSDEKTETEKLTFSATVEPADRVAYNIAGSGNTRTLTLSRNQRESGPVKLAVRLVTPDGRETNHTYSVSVVPLPSPTLAIDVNSTNPQKPIVRPGEEMTWTFTVGGGTPSEKPAVSAESLSPSALPQAALKLEALDETNRKYKLTARPAAAQGGSVEIRISARLAGTIQNTTLSFTVAASTVAVPMVTPPVVVVRELLKKARAAWIERRYQEAIGYCDDAIARDPQSVEAWTIKAGVNYSWLRYPEAIAACDAAIAINSKFADAWFTKGSSEEKSANLQGALTSYRKFLETVQVPDARIPVVEDRLRKLEGQ